MPFSFKKTESVVNLHLIGDIDLEITTDLKQQLVDELEDCKALNIDGSMVTYIDSSGVSILVIAMQTCNKNDIDLSITKVSDELLRVLELARLDRLLPISEHSGPANITDIDIFSKAGAEDRQIAENLDKNDISDRPQSDTDIANALAGLKDNGPAEQNRQTQDGSVSEMTQSHTSIEDIGDMEDIGGIENPENTEEPPGIIDKASAPTSPASASTEKAQMQKRRPETDTNNKKDKDGNKGNSNGLFRPGTF